MKNFIMSFLQLKHKKITTFNVKLLEFIKRINTILEL